MEKVEEIVEKLAQFQSGARLYSVPLLDIQKDVVTETPPQFRVLLYRRFMIRITEHFARLEKCAAIATGESLAQVASQTLENIGAIEAVANMPILRPVIGWDKQEIISEAKRFDTYHTSIQPHGDCCSYLMPEFPATRSSAPELEAAESALNVQEMVDRAIEQTETRDFRAAAAPVRTPALQENT